MVRTVFMVSNTSRSLVESDNSSTIALLVSDSTVFYIKRIKTVEKMHKETP